MSVPPLPSATAADLLAWYDRHHRRLPWRVDPPARARGVRPDPYRVWLSEIMLQQTTVQAVKGYFEAFLARWPTVGDLAGADEAEVMKAWAGLGYYSRARNLDACAKTIVRDHGGRFPSTEAELLGLPGIGAYTAAAIAAIAFDRPAAVVDGNVERVMARLHRIATPLPAAKAEIRAATAALVPSTRPGDFAQAMMDLGATVCTPKKPACSLCPWSGPCAARAAGDAETYPVKAAKAVRPTRTGVAFVAIRADGAVLLRRRPAKGLLGGMSEPPGTAWSEAGPSAAEAAEVPVAGSWTADAARVGHTFTHFHLDLTVAVGRIAAEVVAPEGHWWSGRQALSGEALPTVFVKAIAAGRAVVEEMEEAPAGGHRRLHRAARPTRGRPPVDR